MYKEIKSAWIQAMKDLNESIKREKDTFEQLSDKEREKAPVPSSVVKPISLKGWFTSTPMKILVEILEKMFDEKLDFNPREHGKGMRHQHFNKIQELSGLDRLDFYLPSYENYLKERKVPPGERQMLGEQWTLSMIVHYGITWDSLIPMIEKDITERTEPLILEWTKEKKEEKKKPAPPKPQPKEEVLDDLPF